MENGEVIIKGVRSLHCINGGEDSSWCEDVELIKEKEKLFLIDHQEGSNRKKREVKIDKFIVDCLSLKVINDRSSPKDYYLIYGHHDHDVEINKTGISFNQLQTRLLDFITTTNQIK
ncbi:MAG: hypothetical protein WDK96_00035 [Candidatus Paceibacterota bacterium]|jgi:hypothetical protein